MPFLAGTLWLVQQCRVIYVGKQNFQLCGTEYMPFHAGALPPPRIVLGARGLSNDLH